MASSVLGLNLEVFGFLPTTRAKTITKPMRSRSVAHHVAFYACFLLHPQTAVHAVTYAPDKPWLFWLREKTQRPPIWATCRDKNVTGSGISGVYLRFLPLFTRLIVRIFSVEKINLVLITFMTVEKKNCESRHALYHCKKRVSKLYSKTSYRNTNIQIICKLCS